MSSNQTNIADSNLSPPSFFPSLEKVMAQIDVLFPRADPPARECIRNLFRVILTKGVSLEARIRVLLRQKYGRQSETLSDAQLLLFAVAIARESSKKDGGSSTESQSSEPDQLQQLTDELQAELKEARELEKAEARRKRAERRAKIKARRDQNSEDEARLKGLDRVVHPPAEPCTCGDCNGVHTIIDVETSRRIVYVPAKFELHEDQRYVFAPCPAGKGTITRSPLPDKPIHRGICDYTFLAQLLEWRYADQIPFHHISIMTDRLGYRIPTSTLGDWAEAADELVGPLVEVIIDQILYCELVGVDDTRMPTLAPDEPGHLKKGRLWCYVGYDNLETAFVYYEYTPNWKGEHPRGVLAERTGLVQADGYAGIDPTHFPSLEFELGGCHDHSRRKFDYAVRAGELQAGPVLMNYRHLYAVEELARLRGCDAAGRLALRQKYSAPIVKWLEEQVKRRQRDPLIGPLEQTALTYFINQLPKLTLYLKDGRMAISNIEVERWLRLVARGRRLHLFAGSEAGGKRMGHLYTIVANCLLAGVKPAEWLKSALPKLKKGLTRDELVALLPLSAAGSRVVAAAARASRTRTPAQLVA